MTKKLVAFILYAILVLGALSAGATLVGFINPKSTLISDPTKFSYICLATLGIILMSRFLTANRSADIDPDTRPERRQFPALHNQLGDIPWGARPLSAWLSITLIMISSAGFITGFDPFVPGGTTLPPESPETFEPTPPPRRSGHLGISPLVNVLDPDLTSKSVVVNGVARQASGFDLQAKNCQENSAVYKITPSDAPKNTEFSLEVAESAPEGASYNVHLDNGAGWSTQRPFGPDSPVHLEMDIPSKAVATIQVKSSYVTDETCPESTSFIVVDEGLMTYDP